MADIEIKVDYIPFFNYSYLQALRKPISSVTLTNNLDTPIEHALLKIDSATDLLTDQDIVIENIPAHESIEIDCSGVIVDTHKLLQITERVVDSIAFTLLDSDATDTTMAELGHERVEMVFWAFDQWAGTSETLPTFVTPNHPALAPILVKAAKYLEEWSGSPSLDGYQSGDTHRVRLQAAAVFRAIQEASIIYTGAPASFDAGQRIRLVDAALSQHLATCLDFSVLYASCLEAMDLRPLIFLIKGHAFAGLWLEETSFPEILEEDPTSISRRFAKGVDQLCVVECTMLAKESSATFEDAERVAKHHFDDYEKFTCAVDVHRARMSQIIPLPVRIESSTGWEVQVEENTALGKAKAPEKHRVSTAVLEVGPTKKTKKQLWERSLLDLSMHNNLLNMRPGSRTLPILAASIDEIEDTLASDNDLIIVPRPEEWSAIDEKDAFSVLNVPEEFEGLLEAEFKEGRLRTLFSPTSLKKNLKNLYRAATSSLEETGANTLFLTLGALRWVDEKRGNAFRYSPIILVPIDIVQKSAKEGYIIRMRDDEPQLNISLVEMLRSEFEISVDGLDPLPKDDAGVDTRLVLNTFKKKILNQSGWEVLESVTIGLFSFSQFVMWNDIRNREDDLRHSNIVNSMMEGHLTWTPESLQTLDELDASELLLPVEADASQMIAIQNALADKSFVLHGPPGTGKSQTITAIIANALARGKRVLFVAEKMAALEVVEERLSQMGLGPFCLEIHSTKATRHHVLEQIQAVSELAGPQKSERYQIKADEVAALRKRLDTYANGLSRVNAAGLSLREQICKYEEYQDTLEACGQTILDIPVEFITSITSPQDFAVKLNTIERILAYAISVPNIANHPLRALTTAVYSQKLKEQSPRLIQAYKDALGLAQAQYSKFIDAFSLKTPQTLEDAMIQISGLYEFATAQKPSTVFEHVQDLNRLSISINKTKAHCLTALQLFDELTDIWDEQFLTCDVDAYKREWFEAQSKGFFSKSKAIKKVVSELEFYAKGSIDADQVEPALKQLEQYQSIKRDIDSMLQELGCSLESFKIEGYAYDWGLIDSEIERENNLRLHPINIQQYEQAHAQADDLLACKDTLKQTIDVYRQLRDTLGEFNRESYEHKDAPQGLISIFEIDEQICQDVIDNIAMLRDWAQWNETKSSAHNLCLDFLIEHIEHVGVDDHTFTRICGGIYKAMCITSMDDTEGINSFNSARFNETIKQYTRADEELRTLAREEIYYRIAAHIPDLTIESTRSNEAAQLQKALRSRGRSVSIRSLISDCGDILFKLCPCLLMSPLSVSQYLEPGKEQFDLLIFDEASQLQTCKAIGALSRAKHAVIVGDPKQMPPTSFFQGKVTDEDYEEVSDLESILEDCLALNLPQTYLQWHYRSQHESLISFSNKRFYESKMLTFPSVDDRKSRIGYSFIEEGYFERGGRRVNEAEALAIVRELVERSKDPETQHQSIGIVTLNISQQTLIDDLYQQQRLDNPEFDAWTQNLPEPLFIKNLENVQGDERDIIFFSITYAPDKSGKMSMNFGPINREGGWRRLNVAITRARIGMHVFTSMHSSDIDTQRASSMGPSSLKAFLEYAEKGSFASVTPHEIAQSMQSDTISNEIYDFLHKAGYTVMRNIGKSTFKVDLAVVDPRDDRRYLAGILLDGNSYALASSTRDREISQPKILGRLGWHIYRVWTMDWWEDRERTKQALLSFLNSTYDETNDEVQSILKQEQEHTLQEDTKQIPKHFDEVNTKAESVVSKSESEAADDETITVNPVSITPIIEVAPLVKEEEVLPAKVANKVEAVKEEEHAASEIDTQSEVPVQEQVLSNDFKKEYHVANLQVESLSSDEFIASDDSVLAEVLQQIIDAEAPIEISIAYKRLIRAYGISRMGNKLQAKCDQVLKKARYSKSSQAGRTILWRKDQNPKEYLFYRVTSDDDYRRNADELPLEEIAAASILVLKEQGPMVQDDLIKAASVELGYKRVANTVTDFFKRGITLAARRGFIQRTTGSTYEYIEQ